MAGSRAKVTKYEGGNATMDMLLREYWPDDIVWIVNGAAGRKPVVAKTGEEALEKYEQQASADKVVPEAS